MSFTSFNGRVSKTKSSASRKRRNFRVETLESRNLMAAGIGDLPVVQEEIEDNSVPADIYCTTMVELDAGGTLVIEGTSCDDTASVQAVHENILVTVNGAEHHFDDTESISQIVFRGHNGNDVFHNQTNIPSIAKGGKGSDTLRGGSGIDNLQGNSGKDILYGGRGNDELYGGQGKDELHGDRGQDALYGGTGADSLHGNKGDDELHGGKGSDNLYGDDGNDQLVGNRGRDGLFGGKGDDELSGGRGNDRFLVQQRDSDVVTDRAEEDAVLTFVNGRANWTEAEIELLDHAFNTVHHTTRNTNLLQKQDGDDIQFRRGAVRAGGGYGVNLSSQDTIVLYDGAFNNDNKALKATFHEIGHNWGGSERNTDWQTFLDESGWTPLSPGEAVPPGKVRSRNGAWSYDDGASFARNYGKEKPGEDFATVFSAYFMDKAKVSYVVGESAAEAESRLAQIDGKLAYIDGIVAREQADSD